MMGSSASIAVLGRPLLMASSTFFQAASREAAWSGEGIVPSRVSVRSSASEIHDERNPRRRVREPRRLTNSHWLLGIGHCPLVMHDTLPTALVRAPDLQDLA